MGLSYHFSFPLLYICMFSKTKVENILGLGFNTINLSLYLVAMATTVMKAVVQHPDVSQILTCIYGL